MTSAVVRIRAINAWSFESNECSVRLSGVDDDKWWEASLPPFASPLAEYTVMLDPKTLRILSWVDKPVSLDSDDSRSYEALLDAPSAVFEAAKEALRMGKHALRADVFKQAHKHDLQVVPGMGEYRGILDGLALSAVQRRRLLDNYQSFGRQQRRCLKRPHNVVFPTPDDDLEHQVADFSHSPNVGLQRASRATAAWLALRNARGAFVDVEATEVAAQYGAEVAGELAGLLPLVARVVMLRPPTAFQPNLRFESVDCKSIKRCDAPPTDSKARHWFAPCVAEAEIQLGGNVGYAVHETLGALYVNGGDDKTVTAQGCDTPLSRGGVQFVVHVPVAEGGDQLFEQGSLESVGLYCTKRNPRAWDTPAVRRVLELVKKGGRVLVNSDNLSFLPSV